MKNVLCLFLIIFSLQTFATEDPKLILLRPTGQEIEGLTVMEVYSNSSETYIRMNEIISNSIIKEFLELHEILQTYLYNSTGKPIEPAYLALTKNQGGFAKKGFVIIKDGKKVKKPNSFYVDINIGTLDRPYNSLMSITQLYPHELGHIMYRLLSFSEDIEENSRNVNIHFFSMITDYQIAFNEGFAEHIENIARLFETNEEITEGINNDTIKIIENSQKAINGFRKDFKNPLRFGFYKISMLVWYQQFEDYKRYSYAMDGRSKYSNASISTYNHQNNLIYRNSGVAIDYDSMRNKNQLMASEGTNSTFFTLLSQTNIKDQYLPEEFYTTFIVDDQQEFNPKEQFTPLQNLFIKYFFILDKYVILQKSEKSQLIDFIEGYLIEFPDDAEAVKSSYKKAAGIEYENSLPPEIWLLIKDQEHGILAMDAYAGLNVPFYTFDLNAAEKEDLMMIKGMNKEDTEVILNSRAKNMFKTLDDINEVEELTVKGKESVISSSFDDEYFNNFEFTEELTISSVIKAPIKNLIIYTLIYFIAMISFYFLLFKKDGISVKRKIFLSVKYFWLWIVFVLSGLFIAAIGFPIMALLVITSVSVLLSLLYKDKRRKRSVFMILIMTLVILVSLI